MFSDIQPKAWINSISTLANSSSRVYMNVEGFVRLGEGQTSGWRKLKIEEIVKISLKILKKHPHCFEETDIVLWREAFTNFKNKNNNSASNLQNSQIEELLNWLNSLLQNQQKAVLCLQSLQNNNTQRKAIEQAASVAALDDHSMQLISNYQKESDQLNQTLCLTKISLEIQKIKERLQEELGSSFSTYENNFIQAMIDDCEIIESTNFDKELNLIQMRIGVVKASFVELQTKKNSTNSFTDSYSKINQKLLELNNLFTNYNLHFKLFGKINKSFFGINKHKNFLKNPVFKQFLLNFANEYKNLKYDVNQLNLQSKAGFVLTYLNNIEELSCLIEKMMELKIVNVLKSPSLAEFKIIFEKSVINQICKAEKLLLSTSLLQSNQDTEIKINKLNSCFSILLNLKRFVDSIGVANKKIPLNEIKNWIIELNVDVDSKDQITFNFSTHTPTNKENMTFQNLIKEEFGPLLNNFNNNIVSLKKELSLLSLSSDLLAKDINFAEGVQYQLVELQQTWQEESEIPDKLIQKTRELRDKLQERLTLGQKILGLITTMRGNASSIHSKYIASVQSYCSQILTNAIEEQEFEIKMNAIQQQRSIAEVQDKMQELASVLVSLNIGVQFNFKFFELKETTDSLRLPKSMREDVIQKFELEMQEQSDLCTCLEEIKNTYFKYRAYIKSRHDNLEEIAVNYLIKVIDKSDFESQFLKELQQQSKDLLLSAEQQSKLVELRTQFQTLLKVEVKSSNLKTMQQQLRKWALTQHSDRTGCNVGDENLTTATNYIKDMETKLGILPLTFDF